MHQKVMSKDSLRNVLEKYNLNSFNLEIEQKEEQVSLNNELINVFQKYDKEIEDMKSFELSQSLNF